MEQKLSLAGKRREEFKKVKPQFSFREKLRSRCLTRWVKLRAEQRREGRPTHDQDAELLVQLRCAIEQECGRAETETQGKIEGCASPYEVSEQMTAADSLWDWADRCQDGASVGCGTDHATWDEKLAELGSEEYDYLMSEMLKCAEQEMKAEEELRIEEYETLRKQELQELQDRADEYCKNESETSFIVLCPICKRRNLLQNHYVIFCGCGGLRLDMQNEALNLPDLKTRLDSVFQFHAANGCVAVPVFSQHDKFGESALYMQCTQCNNFELVI